MFIGTEILNLFISYRMMKFPKFEVKSLQSASVHPIRHVRNKSQELLSVYTQGMNVCLFVRNYILVLPIAELYIVLEKTSF